jgi:hypothetical protein
MNWRNTAENLIITLVSFGIGVVLGAYVTFAITEKVIESNQAVLIEAIHKPSTAISNDYDIKNKKATLDLTNSSKINEDSLNRSNGWWIFKKKKD